MIDQDHLGKFLEDTVLELGIGLHKNVLLDTLCLDCHQQNFLQDRSTLLDKETSHQGNLARFDLLHIACLKMDNRNLLDMLHKD